MAKAIIFDMDGTLCDVRSIRHHVLTKPRNFEAFHTESVNCPPHAHVVQAAVDAHARGETVIIVTARQEKFKHHTTFWLNDNNVPFDLIFMRRTGDGRPDSVIKSEILAEIVRLGHQVEMAWDDNPSVIELWTSHGIPVTEVPGWEH